MNRIIRSAVAAAALATVATLPAEAQTKFLTGASTGFGVDAGGFTMEEASGFGGGISLAANGLFDVGLGANRYSFNEGFAGQDLTAYGVVPSAAVHIVKPSASRPLGLTVAGSYEWITYADDVLDDADVDMKGSFYTLGGGLYSKFRVSSVVDVLPTLHVQHRAATVEQEDPLGNALSSDKTGTDFSFTPSVGFSLGPVNVLHLDPTVTVNDRKETSFKVSMGFALPIKVAG